MTPKSKISRTFRDAVLTLAGKHAFARPLVNTGRLSVPCVYDSFPLFTADTFAGPTISRPGAVCPDAPLGDGYLLDHVGDDFVLLAIGCAAPAVAAHGIQTRSLQIDTPSAPLRTRYLGDEAAAVYPIRPDQHIAARWTTYDAVVIAAALKTAIGKA